MEADDDRPQFETQTWSSGGFSLALSPGTFDLTASDAFLTKPTAFDEVVIADLNLKLDFCQDTDADFITPSLTYEPGNHGNNSNIAIDGVVENQGAAPVTRNFTIEVLLYLDQVWQNEDDVVLFATVYDQSLDAGGQGQFPSAATLGSEIPQDDYFVAVKVDSAQEIAKANDLNNLLWPAEADVSISPPQPMIALTSPGQILVVLAGAAVPIRWTDNDGDNNASIELYFDLDISNFTWQDDGQDSAQLMGEISESARRREIQTGHCRMTSAPAQTATRLIS